MLFRIILFIILVIFHFHTKYFCLPVVILSSSPFVTTFLLHFKEFQKLTTHFIPIRSSDEKYNSTYFQESFISCQFPDTRNRFPILLVIETIIQGKHHAENYSCNSSIDENKRWMSLPVFRFFFVLKRARLLNSTLRDSNMAGPRKMNALSSEPCEEMKGGILHSGSFLRTEKKPLFE